MTKKYNPQLSTDSQAPMVPDEDGKNKGYFSPNKKDEGFAWCIAVASFLSHFFQVRIYSVLYDGNSDHAQCA